MSYMQGFYDALNPNLTRRQAEHYENAVVTKIVRNHWRNYGRGYEDGLDFKPENYSSFHRICDLICGEENRSK